MEKIVATLAELSAEAASLAAQVSPKATGATLVTLSGELGAGKTAFTKALAKAFGITEVVNSPTFIIEKAYAIPAQDGNHFRHLIHIDAYRLSRSDELSVLGFDELMKEKTNLVVLEWPERTADRVRTADVRISIKTLPDGSRLFSYENKDR